MTDETKIEPETTIMVRLTDEQIHELKPGLTLDMLTHCLIHRCDLEAAATDAVPAYSADIGHAWNYVVPYLHEENWLVIVKHMPKRFPFWAGSGWSDEDGNVPPWKRCAVELSYQARDTPKDTRRYIMARVTSVLTETAAEAICKAALLTTSALARADRE